MIDRELITCELTRDEGQLLTVYDDATGAAIKPGTSVKGHPTIGIGRALDVHGISAAEAAYLLGNDIDGIVAQLSGGAALVRRARRRAPARAGQRGVQCGRGGAA